MSDAVKMTGWKEFAATLKDFPQKVQRNVLRTSLDRAGRKIADQARQTSEFRDRTGELRKSIKLKRVKPTPTVVGADVVAASPHAHLIEKGWMQRTSGGSRQIEARPFLAPALNDHKQETLDYIAEQIRKLIDKARKKYTK